MEPWANPGRWRSWRSSLRWRRSDGQGRRRRRAGASTRAARCWKSCCPARRASRGSSSDKAECVAVIPSAKKFALGLGGRYGKGAVACRSGGPGTWSAPLMISIGGGSFGLQIGGQAADYVFLVMNPKGIDYLLRSQFTLGADAAVAAGPLGRTGSAGTDLRMHAEILSYSRTRGLFAGLSLEGAVVKQDKDGNQNLYGEPVDAKRLLQEGRYAVPSSARGMLSVLENASPRHKTGG